jgi:hypothetical protein
MLPSCRAQLRHTHSEWCVNAMLCIRWQEERSRCGDGCASTLCGRHCTPSLPGLPPLLGSNYRACVRAHQSALSAQRALWMALLHDTLTYDGLRAGFGAMQSAQAQAHQVYRR